MRSQLGTYFVPFFRLIARILTFRDKKVPYFNVSRQNRVILHGALWLSLAHSGSLWLAVRLSLALSGSLWLSVWLSLALSGSLWLPLALSGSLWLSIALQICLPSPCSAHKALAQLGTPFLRSLTLISPVQKTQTCSL